MENIRNFICGINTKHDLGYVSPQRLLTEVWVIMCFSTPFIIDSPNGLLIGEQGDFIINRPYNHFWHTNTEDAKTGFVNCWCHFIGDGVRDFFEKYDLFPDILYHTVDDNTFMCDLIDIEKEIYNKRYYSDDMLELLLKKMIINLSRQNEMYDIKYNVTDKQVDGMVRLRNSMLENYINQYNVNDLAKELHLSGEYFFVLYKKIFNISPMKDLCLKRMSAAKMLLISTDMPISIIANSCGYSDPNYFSRLFKKITGISPLQYRK
ncbi:MAG: AraC family transcriptional regulator [Oscillospiraceae bacterium]|nr:AraC family transcriptional regulator [Oscillospiraceae bacterium]